MIFTWTFIIFEGQLIFNSGKTLLLYVYTFVGVSGDNHVVDVELISCKCHWLCGEEGELKGRMVANVWTVSQVLQPSNGGHYFLLFWSAGLHGSPPLHHPHTRLWTSLSLVIGVCHYIINTISCLITFSNLYDSSHWILIIENSF